MSRKQAVILAVLCSIPVGATDATAQARPDFSGVWRLDPAESRMIGAGGRSGPARLGERRITWLIDHRDPEIAVVVDVRDPGESREFSFRCTTDGRACLNQLPELDEVRHMSAVWEGDVLVMTQRAETPHGEFHTEDRLSMSDSGDRLIFERVVRNEGGERSVRQVFRKLGPHPSRQPDPPAALPSVDLPPELDRVLRDYERHWRAGDAAALAALFTEDGFASSRGGWIRGRDQVGAAYEGTSSPLRLRALAFAAADTVAYIVGAYGYGEEQPAPDRGRFLLALRRSPGGPWLIAADLDAGGSP